MRKVNYEEYEQEEQPKRDETWYGIPNLYGTHNEELILKIMTEKKVTLPSLRKQDWKK